MLDVLRAGQLLNDSPNDLRLFGMAPITWYLLGIRIVGRTAVEATRDPQARFFARAVTATLREHGHEIHELIDPFVGSGNVLYHFAKETTAARGLGIELNPDIVRRTRRNFEVLHRWKRLSDVDIEIHEGDWSRSSSMIGQGPTLIIIDPPWGDAYSKELGLDLRSTQPPIPEILEKMTESSGSAGPLFAAVKTIPGSRSVDVVVGAYRAFEALRPHDAELARWTDYLLLQLR